MNEMLGPLFPAEEKEEKKPAMTAKEFLTLTEQDVDISFPNG